MPLPEQDPAPSLESGQEALLSALDALLRPLARLAVADGLPFSAVETALKLAFVEAAQQALSGSGLPAHRLVSRISTSTGINRREVTRLTREPRESVQPSTSSLSSEVFTRWLTEPALQGGDGRPRPLKRQGPAPSFETLSRSVTQDIHPRSLLEELCRLGLARLDESDDTVHLSRDAFVPKGDKQRMLAFLADNVGDHLDGAVHNVLGDGRQHFDQAVFADELSSESLAEVRQFVQAQWKRLLAEAVPMLEQRIEGDRSAGRAQDRRLRIGLYAYDNHMAESAVKPAAKRTSKKPKQVKGQ